MYALQSITVYASTSYNKTPSILTSMNRFRRFSLNCADKVACIILKKRPNIGW
jgi:hypothetical protein